MLGAQGTHYEIAMASRCICNRKLLKIVTLGALEVSVHRPGSTSTAKGQHQTSMSADLFPTGHGRNRDTKILAGEHRQQDHYFYS